MIQSSANYKEVISLYDMLEFNARHFTYLMTRLVTLEQLCDAHAGKMFNDMQRKNVDDHIGEILSYCKKLSLPLSTLALKRMLVARELKTDDVSLQLGEAKQRIFDELKSEAFFHIGKEKSQ